MTPQSYHEHLAFGSTAVRDWIDGWKAGDMTEWSARYMTGPMLDRWRQMDAALLPEWAGIAELIDAARFGGTASTLRGSLVEAYLWNADDPAEIEWADGGKASARAIEDASRTARLIFRSCPKVREVMAIEGLERQVSEFAELEGAARPDVLASERVAVKSRIDLAWDLPATEEDGTGRVLVDFKLWTGWSYDVGHLVAKWGADVQAAHYRLISEALHPGVEHFSALLVVDPGGRGKLPKEFWHEFPEHTMQASMDEVREALGQIAAMTQREEKVA